MGNDIKTSISPLIWTDFTPTQNYGLVGYYKAQTPFCCYKIGVREDSGCYEPKKPISYYPFGEITSDLDDAKRQVQEHWEQTLSEYLEDF